LTVTVSPAIWLATPIAWSVQSRSVVSTLATVPEAVKPEAWIVPLVSGAMPVGSVGAE